MTFIGDLAFGRDASPKPLDQNRYITAAYRWDQPYRQVMAGTRFDEADLADNLFMKEVHVDVDDPWMRAQPVKSEASS